MTYALQVFDYHGGNTNSSVPDENVCVLLDIPNTPPFVQTIRKNPTRSPFH